MKLLNYDSRFLIMQNMKDISREVPTTYSRAQYNILCRLIIQKKITEKHFYFLLSELYNMSDWKQLNYQQMYELIHILTYWNYK